VTPIGLDIGVDEIRMLQFGIGEDGAPIAVHAAQRAPHLAGANAADTIKRMIRQGGFAGRHVVVALPREIVQVRNARLPVTAPESLRAAVEDEAARTLELHPNTSQIRFISAGQVRQGDEMREEVILIAAKQAEVEQFVESLLRVGLTVDSIDFEPCALYRGVQRIAQSQEHDQASAVVDLSGDRTQVVIGRGEQLCFFKQIEFGQAMLHDAVGRKLGISVEEARALRRRLFESGTEAIEDNANEPGDPVRQAVLDATRRLIDELGRQILTCMRYHAVTFRGQRPAKLLLTGAQACDEFLRAQLAPHISLPLEAAISSYSILDSAFIGDWAVAAGLALKGVAAPVPAAEPALAS